MVTCPNQGSALNLYRIKQYVPMSTGRESMNLTKAIGRKFHLLNRCPQFAWLAVSKLHLRPI